MAFFLILVNDGFATFNVNKTNFVDIKLSLMFLLHMIIVAKSKLTYKIGDSQDIINVDGHHN